jgi:hypothetical protein
VRFIILLVGALFSAANAVAAEPSFVLLREVALSGKFQNVLGFDVTPDGGVVVVDRDAPAIVAFDKAGRLVRSYSHPGARHCEITTPEAVAVTPRGIAVWDQKRHHLMRFTAEGVCVADDVVLDYEIDRGALARVTGGFLAGGDTLTGPPCALFFVGDGSPAQLKSCFHTVADQARWLLYGRSYVASRADTVYFAVPYDSTVWTSNGLGRRAFPLRSSSGRIPQEAIPADERQIRSSRTRYYDFYESRRVVEGLAAVDRGVVLVTGSPDSRRQVTMTLFRDDGSEGGATTTFSIDDPRGVYAVHARGDGRKRVYLLLAHGNFPSVRYSVRVYEIR